MKWLILLVALSLSSSVAKADLKAPPPNFMRPPKKMAKPYKPPDHPIVKFLKEDIWEIKRMTKQCIESENASLCASAKSVYPEPVVFIVFKWTF